MELNMLIADMIGYQQNVSPLKNTIAYNFFVYNQNPAKNFKDTEINDLHNINCFQNKISTHVGVIGRQKCKR